MKNKRIKFIASGLVISSLVVGGTFAWLGANDSVKNIFVTEASQNSGIRVDEDFDDKSAEEMRTGKSQAIKKQVRVQNTSDYNSLIRVKLETIFTDEKGNIDNNLTEKLSKYVEYTYSEYVSVNGKNMDTGIWTYNNEDKYFYYIGNIAPGYYTNNILEEVWLNPEISKDDAYKSIKNIDFQVNVIAEGVSSTIEGITSKDTDPDTEYNLGFGLEYNEPLINALKNIIKVDSKGDSSISGGFPQKQQ